MKKLLKKITSSILASVVVVLSLTNVASAETIISVKSTGGTGGYMYYNLSAENYYSHAGIDFYQIKATAKQNPPLFSQLLSIKEIEFNTYVFFKSGSINHSSETLSPDQLTNNINGEYLNPKVADSAVTTDTYKGYSDIWVKSYLYGNIRKNVKNY